MTTSSLAVGHVGVRGHDRAAIMSLLDQEGDPFDFEPDAGELLRPATDSPLVVELFRPRDRKEKRGKLTDESARKASAHPLRRGGKAKEKEGDKTPKKSKGHQRSKSGSRTPPPPDSPKLGGRTEVVVKRPAPSPSAAKRSKRYSQLGGDDLSSDEDDSYFMTNRLPQTPPPSSPPPSPTSPVFGFPPASLSRRSTVQFPVQFSAGQKPATTSPLAAQVPPQVPPLVSWLHL